MKYKLIVGLMGLEEGCGHRSSFWSVVRGWNRAISCSGPNQCDIVLPGRPYMLKAYWHRSRRSHRGIQNRGMAKCASRTNPIDEQEVSAAFSGSD